MAACRGVVQVASDLGLVAGPAARIQPGRISASKLRRGVPRRATRLNCSTSPRTMESLSVTAVAGISPDYSAASEEQMLRRADSYFATDSRPIVLFDDTQFPPLLSPNLVAPEARTSSHGVCNFCNAGVNFVLDNDPEGVRMAALQSDAGRALLLRAGRSSDDLSSLVLVEKGRSYIKSEGVLRMAQYLGNVLPPLGNLGLLFPLFFRDFVYDNVANNRYLSWAGGTNSVSQIHASMTALWCN